MSEARLLALFTLALGPAATALIAWLPLQAGAPRLLMLALGTALAISFGETFRPGQHALREKSGLKLRIWAQVLCGGLLLLSLLFAAAAPRAALLGRQTLLALTIQLLFLSLPDLGIARLPALAASLSLAVLAAFRGGTIAVLALASYALGLTAFLVLDHFTARLALRPAAVPALRATAYAELSRLLATVSLALALGLLVFPPSPHGSLDAPTLDSLEREKMAPAYLQLAFVALLGAGVVHYASRLLRLQRDAKPKAVEELVAERRAEEVLAERPPRARPSYAGARGRVVRAYVGFVSEASGRELVRRPDQTPREIAAKLGAAGTALETLTALFSRARYGRPEPSEAEALEAEALSGGLVGWLEERRGTAPR
jgi:hypothetical protein